MKGYIPKFKIIRVRICPQCHDTLGPCRKCIKHPNRKPEIVERFALPKIHEQCKCGLGIRISCQVDDKLRPTDCKRDQVWKAIRHAKEARKFEDLFCGRRCASIMTGQKRKTREMVVCSNRKCEWGPGKTRNRFEIHQYKLNVQKDHFCCGSCKWIEYKMRKAEALDIEKIERRHREKLQRELEEKMEFEEKERQHKIGHTHKCTMCSRSAWVCYKNCSQIEKSNLCDRCMNKFEHKESVNVA